MVAGVLCPFAPILRISSMSRADTSDPERLLQECNQPRGTGRGYALVRKKATSDQGARDQGGRTTKRVKLSHLIEQPTLRSL